MTDQQNDGDAKAIDAVVVLENYSVSPDGHPVKVKASYLAELGYVPAAELEAVRLELGKWIQLANRIHQAAHTTAVNDGLPARVEELFQATEELRTQLTTERARRLPWKELARQNGVAFRAAHKQLADTERQLALSRAGYRGAEEAIRKANEGATTERARAEEVEGLLRFESRNANRHYKEVKRLTTELAAATARAGRLEEALDVRKSLVSDWGDVANWLLTCGWHLPSFVHGRIKRLREHLANAAALSVAPQASTRQDIEERAYQVGVQRRSEDLEIAYQPFAAAPQASTDSRPPMATGFTEADRNTMTHVCRKCGKLNMGSCATCATAPQVSTEQVNPFDEAQANADYVRALRRQRGIQTSPIPQVAQASAWPYCQYEGMGCCTGRCEKAGKCEKTLKPFPRPLPERAAQPKPPEPSDYVTRGELVAMLFKCEHRCTTVPEFAHYLMKQLEGK